MAFPAIGILIPGIWKKCRKGSARPKQKMPRQRINRQRAWWRRNTPWATQASASRQVHLNRIAITGKANKIGGFILISFLLYVMTTRRRFGG